MDDNNDGVCDGHVCNSHSLENSENSKDVKFEPGRKKDRTPKKNSQSELNDLARKLRLAKDEVEGLASFLKSKNYLTKSAESTVYRNREK